MRLFPRVLTSLPVIVEQNQNHSKTVITNLSTGGAYIQTPPFPIQPGDALLMKYQVPNYGRLEHSGKALRLESNGLALRFYPMGQTIKERLWRYVLDHLGDLEACPYCGDSDQGRSLTCRICGWRLDFQSPTYIEYHERRSLLEQLVAKAEHLEMEKIRHLLDSIGTDPPQAVPSQEGRKMVGASPVMLEVLEKIRKIAPVDIPVLILGESGTGKRLAAWTIHEQSLRKAKPFIPVHCSAISETLLEAELMGYEKGSLPGADFGKIGRVEQADGGTLFLNEIGELSLGLQGKLLRLLENGVVERVGGLKSRKVDVRLIASSNRDLQTLINQERFRSDLYYRLSGFTLSMPPVRERGPDKILLSKFFLDQWSSHKEASKKFTDEALELIARYHWPGNVREIINRVRRAILMSNDQWIRPEDLDIEPFRDPALKNVPLRHIREKLEKEKIEAALRLCQNNISKAARMLEISRPTVYALKRKYGL